MLEQLGTFEPVGHGEISRRIEALKSLMADKGVDFAVIMQNADMFYFTGTIQKGMLVVPSAGEPLLFIEKSVGRARQETPLGVISIGRDRDARAILEEKRILQGRGAMELDVLPVAVFERFKDIMGYRDFGDISPLIRELRAVKSPYELEQIRKSGAIIARVFERAKEVVREGASEVEIDSHLIAEGRRRGHQGFLRMRGFNREMMTMCVFAGYSGGIASYADVPIAGAGVTPAIAQGSSLLRVEHGVPVLVDYGGGYNGYVTDETRVYVVGKLQDIFRKPYEVAKEIIEETAIFGKEGVDAAELYRRAQGLVKKAGLEEYFMGHGEGQVFFIGHGLGLEINELPFITARHSRTLKEGMVFAFEPKFVFPGRGVVGLEADFIVRKDRLERVVDTPLDIVYI